MIKFYTGRALLLLSVGLWFSGPAWAETPFHNSGGEAVDAADCPMQSISSALVRGVVEKLGAGFDLSEFWHNPNHLAGLLDEIDELQADGLSPEHYHFSLIQQMYTSVQNGNRLSGCDMAIIGSAYISALHDLHFGRVDPLQNELIWYADVVQKVPREVTLLVVAGQGVEQGINRAFTTARPGLPLYRDLRDAYQQALATFPASWVRTSGGALLRAGDVDPRVEQIRLRLAESGYLAPPDEFQREELIFSSELSDVVRKFQFDHNIVVDGVVGPDTINQLNVQPSTRIDQLRINLERLRWFAQDKESTMVLVDIAGAELSYTKNRQRLMLTRVVAGRKTRETPPLKSLITHVTLNPTWTVPPTILRKDIFPAIRKDITYLADHHMRVFDYSGNELDPERINWGNPGRVLLRQDAGPYTALGKVAIRFENPFQVFLHDTPNKKVFADDKRFYSSGCVRVQNAVTLTEWMFEDAPETLAEKLSQSEPYVKTVNVTLPAYIPLLMVYWTAIVDEGGDLRFRPDIYGRDIELLALLEQG